MDIVSSAWLASGEVEREPSDAELAAIEGAELSHRDRSRVQAYWDRVIKECYPATRPAPLVSLPVAAEPRIAPVVEVAPAAPAWLLVEDEIAELDGKVRSLVSGGRGSKLVRRRVQRTVRRSVRRAARQVLHPSRFSAGSWVEDAA